MSNISQLFFKKFLFYGKQKIYLYFLQQVVKYYFSSLPFSTFSETNEFHHLYRINRVAFYKIIF
jgi:hypothetical protein